MKRILFILLSIIMMVLFSSIVLTQQDSSKQQKPQDLKTNAKAVVKPDRNAIKPGQRIGKQGVFGPGEWGIKKNQKVRPDKQNITAEDDWEVPAGDPNIQNQKLGRRPLDGKGGDMINKNALQNRAASGMPTGKRQFKDKIAPDHKVNTDIQPGVNKVSPDVIDPIKGKTISPDHKVNTEIRPGVNKVSPDVIDPLKNKNVDKNIKGDGGEIKIKAGQHAKMKGGAKGNKEKNK